jgi:hypothetical protein
LIRHFEDCQKPLEMSPLETIRNVPMTRPQGGHHGKVKVDGEGKKASRAFHRSESGQDEPA